MTNNNGEIQVQGAGLPVWDPDHHHHHHHHSAGPESTKGEASDATRTGTTTRKGSLLPQPELEQGSLIISCKVVFPESLSRRGGRLSGLEIAGADDNDAVYDDDDEDEEDVDEDWVER